MPVFLSPFLHPASIFFSSSSKKKAGKVIREHGENYGAVADVDPKISPLEEDEKTQEFIMALDMYKNAKGTSEAERMLQNLKKV